MASMDHGSSCTLSPGFRVLDSSTRRAALVAWMHTQRHRPEWGTQLSTGVDEPPRPCQEQSVSFLPQASLRLFSTFPEQTSRRPSRPVQERHPGNSRWRTMLRTMLAEHSSPPPLLSTPMEVLLNMDVMRDRSELFELQPLSRFELIDGCT